MFGIDDMLIWGPLLGGAMGALTNKDPLKGAALGAGMGALGGAVMPQLAGAAGATGTGIAGGAAGGTGLTMGSSGMGLSAGGGLGLNAGSGGLLAANAPVSSPGLLGGLGSGFKSAMDMVKPVGEAASTANAVMGLLGPKQSSQAPIASPVVQSGATGPGALTALVGGQGQMDMLKAQQEMERRFRQRELIGRMNRGIA